VQVQKRLSLQALRERNRRAIRAGALFVLFLLCCILSMSLMPPGPPEDSFGFYLTLSSIPALIASPFVLFWLNTLRFRPQVRALAAALNPDGGSSWVSLKEKIFTFGDPLPPASTRWPSGTRALRAYYEDHEFWLFPCDGGRSALAYIMFQFPLTCGLVLTNDSSAVNRVAPSTITLSDTPADMKGWATNLGAARDIIQEERVIVALREFAASSVGARASITDHWLRLGPLCPNEVSSTLFEHMLQLCRAIDATANEA
jgi:hypothetical protein